MRITPLICTLLLLATPALAGPDRDPSGTRAAQHGIDGDRRTADRQDANAAAKLATGHLKAAANMAANAAATRADIAADLAGCGTCH